MKELILPNGEKVKYDKILTISQEVKNKIFKFNDINEWCKENNLFCFIDFTKQRYHFISADDYDLLKFTENSVWFKRKKDKDTFGIFSDLKRLI